MYWTERKGKIKIEVHDASIIKSNEHPNFTIGDKISIGHHEVIVKGFSRSILGLAYVLDDGDKLFNWLTEQFDAEYHRKQSMSKTPDKVYLTPLECMAASCQPKKDNTIEYVRADYIIEKVEEYLSKHQCEYIDFDELKKYLKGE